MGIHCTQFAQREFAVQDLLQGVGLPRHLLLIGNSKQFHYLR